MRIKYRNIAQNSYNREIYTYTMRGMDIFRKPYYREISTMRGRPMRGLPVFGKVAKVTKLHAFHLFFILKKKVLYLQCFCHFGSEVLRK